MTALGLLLLFIPACGLDEISDELVVTETVPPPDGVAASSHRITRELGLGADGDDIDEGFITYVTISVVGPEEATLFPFAAIQIYASAGGERSLVAEGTDFLQDETSRSLSVQYTANIKPFLAASDFSLEWDIIYKSAAAGATYPRSGIDLTTVVGFDIDIAIL